MFQKRLLSGISVCAIAALYTACGTSADNHGTIRPEKPESDRKPSNLNFLILMADQVQWKALRCAGNPNIQTPNLDAMAAQGAYFSQAVCPVPVSGPSRSCMLTGRLMEKTRIYDNRLASEGSTLYDSYDNVLAKAGYYLEYVGKFHSPLDMTDDYSNPARYDMRGRELIKYWERLYRLWLAECHTPAPIQPGEQLLSEGFYCHTPYKPNILDKRYEALMSGNYTPEELKNMKPKQPDCHGTLQMEDEKSITAFQGRETIAALKRAKGKKFAITCSFHSPHAPMLPTSGFRDLYNHADLPVPESIHDNMVSNPYRNGNDRPGLPEYSDEEKIRLMTADYYALVTEVDHWIGEILKVLKSEGMDKNTVVIFLADHGEMLGAHGMREKNNFLEESVRVPLLIQAPDINSSVKVEDVVSCLNLYETIMDYAGLDSKNDGFSLRPLIHGEEAPYDFAVSEWTRANKNVPNLMIRTKEWKLMINIENRNGATDALYHLTEDPSELNNLIFGGAQGEYKAICKELTGKLIGYLEKRDYPCMTALREKYKSFN